MRQPAELLTLNDTMKNFLFLCFLFLSSISIGQIQETNSPESSIQQTFELKKIGTQYSVEQITAVFSVADFCGAYYESKRNSITLNDGAEIELKSKQELISLGIIKNESCFLNDSTPFHRATWSISESNRLMKAHDSDVMATEKKMRVSNNNGQ